MNMVINQHQSAMTEFDYVLTQTFTSTEPKFYY